MFDSLYTSNSERKESSNANQLLFETGIKQGQLNPDLLISFVKASPHVVIQWISDDMHRFKTLDEEMQDVLLKSHTVYLLNRLQCSTKQRRVYLRNGNHAQEM